MKRIYYHYKHWEDAKAGLYDLEKEYDESSVEEMCHHAKDLLTNSIEFYSEGYKMINEWKKSAEVNLSNKARNRQAWIGQATCCYKYAIPERITKIAWNMLNNIEKEEANKIADKLITLWENENVKKISK